MIYSKVQTSGNCLVPDLGCIADVSELPNPSLMRLMYGHIFVPKDYYTAQRLKAKRQSIA